MKVKRIIYIVLLIIWMTSIFIFSSQESDESTTTSYNTVKIIINIIPSISKMDAHEQEAIIEELIPYVRKLAHLTIYTIGRINYIFKY